MSNLPMASVVIPCRNEAQYIRSCLDSVLSNDYPKDRLDVLVVDGMSEDGTRAVVEEYASRYPFIRLLDNHKKITPVAMNIGIRHSKGDFIAIMSAHATYQDNHISKCVQYAVEYDADCVGGVLYTVPRDNSLFGRAVVAALSSAFGVGSSKFRTGSGEPRWVDTVFGGCYRRNVFDHVGLFNEHLARSQDMEFNLRLLRGGGNILLVPSIVSTYYARSGLWDSTKYNFNNGIWAVYPLKFGRLAITWRHAVPLAFVLSLLGSTMLALYVPAFASLLGLVVTAYLLTNLAASVRVAHREGDARLTFVLPIAFATLHLTYGFGSLYGLLQVLTSNRFWCSGIRELIAS